MPKNRISTPTAAGLLAALAISFGVPSNSNAQEQSASRLGTSQQHVQSARASWTPTRTNGKASGPSKAAAPAPTRPRPKTSRSTVMRPKPQAAVQQSAYQVPTPPPMQGEVVYEPVMVDGSCDAMELSCGCEAPGCDAMGSCSSGCGCSLCGELPSGRAWRPALTLSLPQDGWFAFEGLAMRGDAMVTPALVTTSPAGTPKDDAGVLPGATTLLGGQSHKLFEGTFNGWRLNGGFWLDRCHTTGLGVDYFELDRQHEFFSATSTGNPIYARPFFNTLTGREDAGLISFNDAGATQLTGTVNVGSYSELAGGGFYLRRLMCCEEGCRARILGRGTTQYCLRREFRVGYRYMQLNEGVLINEQTVNAGSVNRGELDITDAFGTKNQFNGIDLVWSQRATRGFWTFEGLIRLGIGNNRQTVNVAGQTTIVDRNDPNNVTSQTLDGGFLALATNSGEHKQDEFAVIPELNLTFGYQLSDQWKLSLGYTGIYWSNVVRPGQHIPRNINPDFMPPIVASAGSPRPLFAFDTTDYWVSGLNYGLEYRW